MSGPHYTPASAAGRRGSAPSYFRVDLSDYLVLDEGPVSSCWLPGLVAVLAAADGPMSRAEILSRWPTTHPTPSRATLCRALEQACASGRLSKEGTGNRHDPYRYRLEET